MPGPRWLSQIYSRERETCFQASERRLMLGLRRLFLQCGQGQFFLLTERDTKQHINTAAQIWQAVDAHMTPENRRQRSLQLGNENLPVRSVNINDSADDHVFQDLDLGILLVEREGAVSLSSLHVNPATTTKIVIE
ncbi:hypothetical protein ROHU_032703 [Labeo rohita]|uniref:Uncharacterized protein n=1 Tax=Labeo rohita TaxID=84645 RepID=A0A498LIZ1_LABRO|nr:hypothetical protein ROHU_032703 [Labeo rohita]